MKISVALCTYNGERFLQQQIDSILNQKIKVDEIVVCDDGSTDNTISILNNYQEKHPSIFRIFVNEKNLKSVKNFEKAIGLCTGDIIFLSDQDDIWSLKKVETYVNYFKLHPEINLVCSNGYIIDENGTQQEFYTLWDIPSLLTESKTSYSFDKLFALYGNFATGATMAFTKNVIKGASPFPEIQNFHHDEWLALYSSFQKKFAFIDEKLFSYRIHINQQVGGVIFPKNEHSKRKLLQKYDSVKTTHDFQYFKRKFRSLNKKIETFTTYLKSNKNSTITSLLEILLTEKNKTEMELSRLNRIYFIFFKFLYR